MIVDYIKLSARFLRDCGILEQDIVVRFKQDLQILIPGDGLIASRVEKHLGKKVEEIVHEALQ